MKRTLFQISLVLVLLSVSGIAFGQMWAVRDLTRVYYGRAADEAVPADYSGDGIADLAVFRSSYSLWSIKDLTRVYLGTTGDVPVPADYNGDFSADAAIFRSNNGLWAIRSLSRIYFNPAGVLATERVYFGRAGDEALSAYGRGDYNGDGTADIAIFRSSSGLWAIRDITRVYWGSGEEPVPGDYDGDGTTDVAYFQDSIGKWAVQDLTTLWWGDAGDAALPGDYDGDGTSDSAIFRAADSLWAIRNITRAYFGGMGDQPVPADYSGSGTTEIAVFKSLTSPTPAPTPTPGVDTIYSIQHDGKTGTVTVTGIVNLVYPAYSVTDHLYMDFYLADDSGAYNGIYVYKCDWGPEIGDNVTLTGTVGTYNGKTQLENVSSLTVNSTGNSPYGPATVTAGQVTDEQYEGCLVKVESLQVSNENYGDGKWQVNNVDGTVTLDDELDYNYFPLTGNQFTSLIGVVERDTSRSPNQWLQPRFTADFDAADTIIPHYALHGTVVTMDASDNIYDGYYVEVKGDLIEGITASAPSGVDVIEIDGLIFPALINSHDHPNKGAWDIIPLPDLGSYRCLNDWAGSSADPATKQMYNDFKYQSQEEMYPSFTASYPLTKLNEVRTATAGCAVTQGQVKSSAHYHDESSKLGVGIINGERFPGRCLNVIFAASQSSQYWAEQHEAAVKGKLKRYIIHLAQSLTEASGGCEWQEWPWWAQQSSFDGYDTIIHGNSLQGDDFAGWNHPNGRQTVISWVCYCNMVYYGNIADIPAALAHDAVVCIGTDANPWGMPNLLAELNYCKWISDQSGWNIQTRDFIDMVITNGAISFTQLDRMGTIETGKLANFMVIDDGPGDPYDNLLMVAGGGATDNYRCGPKDVRLTIVAGRPIYGDADLLNTTNFPFLYAPYIEDLTICGAAKKVTVARHNNAGIDGVDDLFWDFYSEIWGKYCRSGQYPCDFMPIDPAGVLPPTPVPTVTPPPGTYIITAGPDDATQHSSWFDSASAYVYIGSRSDAIGPYAGGFRFNGVTIPQGSYISSAELKLTQYTGYNSPAVSLKVAADDVDDSPAFTDTASGPLNRTLTTAQVDWDIPVWTVDQQYTSPSIKSVIQEVVDRGGWVSGNSLSVIVACDDTGEKRRRVWSYNGDINKTAQLVVVFSGTTPTPTPEGYKTPTPSPTPTMIPTATPTPEGYHTPTPTPTVTPTPTSSPTPEDYVPTPTPFASNLLLNPGFESWTTTTEPENWPDGSYGKAAYQQEAGTTHGGTYSAKITTTEAAGLYGQGVYQDVDVVVGQSYTFSSYLWAEETGSMGINASWWDGSNATYWNIARTADAGQWNQWTIQSTAPPGTVSARCFIRGFKDTAACGYADDADMRITP